MKVYLVCPECDDFSFGYSSPVAAFDSLEKAEAYIEEHYKYAIFDGEEIALHAIVIELDVQ